MHWNYVSKRDFKCFTSRSRNASLVCRKVENMNQDVLADVLCRWIQNRFCKQQTNNCLGEKEVPEQSCFAYALHYLVNGFINLR